MWFYWLTKQTYKTELCLNGKESIKVYCMTLFAERSEFQDGEEDNEMELSVRSVRANSWGGYRIPRTEGPERGWTEDEQGRLSMAESAAAVAARIAGRSNKLLWCRMFIQCDFRLRLKNSVIAYDVLDLPNRRCSVCFMWFGVRWKIESAGGNSDFRFMKL
jgi:hypothetical protein